MREPYVRPLPARNENYAPPRPWRCVTHEAHGCAGDVVGAVGAIPVCEAGAAAEIAAQRADRARIEALLDTPEMRAEIAAEMAWEARHS
jgi:hypothetical protein